MQTFTEWLNESTIEKLRDVLGKVKGNGQQDALKVWWHPEKKKAFVSVGDWAKSDHWHKAIATIVGKQNIEGSPESGPDGDGWIQVRDTRRIYDSINGMDNKRKRMIGEL